MIFCIEDDPSIRELILYTLQVHNMDCEGFSCGKDFLEALKTRKPDLIVLDLMLPDLDGMRLLRLLRSDPNSSTIPILIASAKGSEFDKVIGLDEGADDYIVKPFGMMELVSRIKALIRRSIKSQEEGLKCGSLKLEEKSRTVFIEGKKLELSKKEFDLLYFLMRHVNQVITREQILEKIWGYSYEGETRTVDVHIGMLRNKLENHKNYIKTVRGIGYKLEKAE